jgi:hypothetical protein
VQIQATHDSSHIFESWTGTGTGSYTGTDNPAQAVVSGSIVETANFGTNTTATVDSSTGNGPVGFQIQLGTMSGATAVAESSLSPVGKPDVQFPYGLFHFTITGLTAGGTSTVTITYPVRLSLDTQYWKYSSATGWINVTSLMTRVGGRAITLTLTDGGLGDQDGVANGVIVDDGGLGLPPGSSNGNGTVIVTAATPTITSIQIDPGDGSNASAVNVDTYYMIKVNVTAYSGTLANVQRLELRLFQNSTTWPGNLDPERRQAFAWEYNGTWYQLGSGGWTSPDGTYFNTTGSSPPNLSGTQGTFTFLVKVPKVSHYTTADGWYAQAWVEDKSDSQNDRTNLFAVNLYVHLAVPTTISWSASAGSSNVEASGMPFAIQYQSNAVVKLQLNATDPASQYSDTFAASNLRISSTSNPNGPNSQNLSNGLADWKAGLGVTDTGALDAYWFVSVPSGQPTGTYAFTYNMNVAFDQYAT